MFYLKRLQNIENSSRHLEKKKKNDNLFSFWADAYSYIFENGLYTIMAKTIRALASHYLMIQFSIIPDMVSGKWF